MGNKKPTKKVGYIEIRRRIGLKNKNELKRSGNELLSHALRRSTIVAKRFHG